MGVHLDEDALSGLLHDAVHATTEEGRRAKEDELIQILYETEAITIWGQSLARRYRRSRERTEVEDIVSVVAVEIISYVRSITPETLEAIDRLVPHLFWRAKAAVVQWIDSPAVTVAQAMSGVSRRYRQAMMARQEYMAEFGKEPSDRELVNYINAKTKTSRKDAAKQGAIVTEDDVSGRTLNAYSLDYRMSGSDSEYSTDGLGVPTQDDTVRTRGELAITIRHLGDACDQMFAGVTNPTVREVLHAWMSFVLENESPSALAVSGKLGIGRQKAQERIRQVEEVLAVFRED